MHYLIAIGVALAVLAGVYQAGRNSAGRECNAAALQSEIATLKQDLAAEQKARADAARRASEITAEADANEEKVRVLEIEIAKRPAIDRCGASDDDLRRLRQIAPGRQPAPAPRRP